MQLNFPIEVITAIAFALGFVADVTSAFSLSRSLINPSTLLERSSDGIGIFIANDERVHHYQRGRASFTGLRVELR